MKTPILIAIMVVLLAIVGAGTFFAGNAYGQQQAQNIRNDFFRQRQGGTNSASGQFGQNGQGGQGGQFGRPAAIGVVKSINGNVMQVTEQDGTVVTVNVNSQTAIQKTVNGSTGDIQLGERVTVLSDQTGTNITARDIQLRPAVQP